MILTDPDDWIKLRNEFLNTSYLDYSDLDNKLFKIGLEQDEKLAIELKKTNTLNCPLERINPTIIDMIFSLYDKIESIDGKELASQVTSLKFELKTLSSYVDELLEMKKDLNRMKDLLIFKNISSEPDANKNFPSVEIYDLEPIENENPDSNPKQGKCLKRKNILTIFLFISVSVILFDYINLNDKSGTYLPISERIAVYGNNESNELYIMDYVYVHERCHHYWYKYLNKSQREEYTKIYKNATYFVREYSKKNVMEDFADSC